MTYFVITSDEDGVNVRGFDERALLKALAPDTYGDREIRGPFLEKLPEISKGNFWQADGVVIIKGEIIIPKEKKTITEFEV